MSDTTAEANSKSIVPIVVAVVCFVATFGIGAVIPWKITGLPTHILTIHSAIVSVPLLALVALVCTWKDSWRLKTTGWLAAAGIAVLAATTAAVESGEKFRDELFANGDDAQAINEHAEWAGRLRWVVLVFALVLLVHFVLNRLKPELYARLAGVAKVLITILAVLSVIAVIITGHLGSKAVWGDKVEAAGSAVSAPPPNLS